MIVLLIIVDQPDTRNTLPLPFPVTRLINYQAPDEATLMTHRVMIPMPPNTLIPRCPPPWKTRETDAGQRQLFLLTDMYIMTCGVD
eukprot:scaffold5775_cov120-Skeletonema_dohrnii-CCMP3373.AAC.1